MEDISGRAYELLEELFHRHQRLNREQLLEKVFSAVDCALVRLGEEGAVMMRRDPLGESHLDEFILRVKARSMNS